MGYYGQFDDLLEFRTGGEIPNTKYIFLGICRSWPNSVETFEYYV